LAQGAKAVRMLFLALCLAVTACGQRESSAPAPAEAPTVVAPGAVQVKSATLAAVRARRRLNCGVHDGLPGFAQKDARGVWSGFDVDLCRAVAAAVLSDARQVAILPQTARGRFAALQTGQVDLLSTVAAWSYSRDAGLAVNFAGVGYYDRQGLMTRARVGLISANQLAGRRVCVEAASTAAQNLAEFNRSARLRLIIRSFDTDLLARQAYEAAQCEAITAEVSTLAAYRSTLQQPETHVILGDTLSKEPMAPAVREADAPWEDIVRWTLNAMILAEELGVTSANVEASRRRPGNSEIEKLLVSDGQLLGLRDDWAFQVIRQVGNYGEIFERNLGISTPLGLERGLNALDSADPPGLMYSLPMR